MVNSLQQKLAIGDQWLQRTEHTKSHLLPMVDCTNFENSEEVKWICGLPVMTSVTSFTLSSVHLMRAARTFLRRRDTTVVMGTRMMVTVSPANAGKT